VLQARGRGDGDPLIRAGFTATKTIGGAVVRNRAKRRLKEAARALLPTLGRPGMDYVFIARRDTGTRAWSLLLDDIERALVSVAPAAFPDADGPVSSPPEDAVNG
jgi:ribonuclease P protein component